MMDFEYTLVDSDRCVACGGNLYRILDGWKCEDCSAIDFDEDDKPTDEEAKLYQEAWDLNDDSHLDL